MRTISSDRHCFWSGFGLDYSTKLNDLHDYFVGTKAEGRISDRWIQETNT